MLDCEDMSNILYDEGKKLGEISDWSVILREPVYKNVLGKTVLSVPANNECTFVSPKPVHRRSKLTVRQDGLVELVLQIKAIKGATFVTALIVSKKEISPKPL